MTKKMLLIGLLFTLIITLNGCYSDDPKPNEKAAEVPISSFSESVETTTDPEPTKETEPEQTEVNTQEETEYSKIQVDNLMPGVYTVTEQNYDRYEPQEVRRVTVVAGQVAKVTFSNVLKRGDLQVIKSSEDDLVEGVTFRLYGTSLSGIAVDEYAVTDKNGVARRY